MFFSCWYIFCLLRLFFVIHTNNSTWKQVLKHEMCCKSGLKRSDAYENINFVWFGANRLPIIRKPLRRYSGDQSICLVGESSRYMASQLATSFWERLLSWLEYIGYTACIYFRVPISQETYSTCVVNIEYKVFVSVNLKLVKCEVIEKTP